MHEPWDENYQHGYEWWLMTEAKKVSFVSFANYCTDCTQVIDTVSFDLVIGHLKTNLIHALPGWRGGTMGWELGL